MAINPPVSHTVISTAQWGIPITDAVNKNATDVAALQPTAWVNLTLLNGWASQLAGSSTPQYRKIGDNVQLRGVVNGGTQGSVIFNLPVGFRPAQFSYRPVAVVVGSAWGIGVIEFASDGNYKYHIYSPPNPTYVDLGCWFSTIA